MTVLPKIERHICQSRSDMYGWLRVGWQFYRKSSDIYVSTGPTCTVNTTIPSTTASIDSSPQHEQRLSVYNPAQFLLVTWIPHSAIWSLLVSRCAFRSFICTTFHLFALAFVAKTNLDNGSRRLCYSVSVLRALSTKRFVIHFIRQLKVLMAPIWF